MPEIVVCSFWVHRPKDFPKAADYPRMLLQLDRCCRRFGYRHVVLTDWRTAPAVDALGLRSYGVDLERNLMKACTEAQARWMESPYAVGVDSLFVGADTLIRRDFRGHLPPADLSVTFMKGHKKWRIQNGFMYVSADARGKAAKLFRDVAADVSTKICDDMAAVERALSPMPADYGIQERAGMTVNFLDLDVWNKRVLKPTDPASNAFVLHFFGEDSKVHIFEWAKRNLPWES